MKNLKLLLPVTGTLVGLSLVASAWTQVQDRAEHGSVCFSSDLVGMKVVSRDGEDLGKIEDLVVHPGGEPSYAVLSFGGWLGMGDKLFAMPWSVLNSTASKGDAIGDGNRGGDGNRDASRDLAQKDGARTLVLPLDKERLKAAPGFDKKNWPTMANADWTRDIDAFYKGDVNPDAKQPVTASSSKAALVTWRVSELKGFAVTTPQGEKLGDIEKVAIDPSGRVSYVALDVADFVDIDDRMVAVPWGALKFSTAGDKGFDKSGDKSGIKNDKKSITLSSTKEQLELAPQFKNDKDHNREMCDPKWIDGVYQYYSIQPYNAPRTELGTRGSNQ